MNIKDLQEPVPSAKGTKPAATPFAVAQFDRLRQTNIDTLVDSVKYFSSSGAVCLGLFANWAKDALTPNITTIELTFVVVSFLSWFAVILAGVYTIYPRSYEAENDAQKAAVVNNITSLKRKGSLATLWLFVFSIFSSSVSFICITSSG